MDELYIPGFTNYLNSGVSSYGMAAGQPMYNDVTLYGDKVGSPYGLMSDEYNAPVGGALMGDVPLGAVSPSSTPTAAVTSPYTKPSATPGLDFVTDRGGQQGYYFVTNAGRAAKTKANPTGFVSADPNAQYRLVNERGQNVVVTSGSGEQGLRDAYAAAQRLSAEGGTKANWYLERSGPEGQWTRIADDDPKGSDLGAFGKIAGFALPIATAILTGGMSLPAQMALSGVAGAAGGALAGKDPLKGGLLSAATAGLVGATGLDKAIGSALGNLGGQTAGQTAGQVAGQTAGGAAGDIVVNALTRAAQGAGSAIAQGGLQAGLNAATSGSPMSGGSGSSSTAGDVGADVLSGEAPIVVSATQPITGVGSGLAQGLAGFPTGLSGRENLGFTSADANPSEIVVSGTKAQPLSPYVPVPGLEAPDVLGLTGANAAPTQPETPLENEIVVSGTNAQPLSPYVPTTGLTGTRANMGFTGARDGATAPEGGGTTLKDIADYLRLAGIGTSLLGGLAGGGGGGGGQRFNIPSTMGQLSPVFGGSLPTANLPGLGGGTAGATRPPSEMAGQGLNSPIDYYRYGYGPQQSFFNYVPQGAPNTSQAYTGYYEGGHAVEGPGDGRDDQIPALLSDGEYVIDAETVALLGNGSNKAGAEMLDAFRVNVRKQKGQKLARGEFSENAKRPEHYMAGGLS
jgi:hypothetical protein